MLKQLARTLCLSRWTIAILGALALFADAPVARAVTVDTAHPRFYFYPDSLAVIRDRALNGGNNVIWVRYKNWVDQASLTDPGNMMHFAAAYLISQNTAYADKAITLAMATVDANTSGFCSGEGRTVGRVSALVLAYDWCFDRLTEAQKTQIESCMQASASTTNISSYAQQYSDYSWPFKYGLVNDTAYDATLKIGLESSINWLRNGCIPCYDQMKPNGAQDGYFGKYYSQMFTFMDVLKHTAGLDLISGSPSMENSWQFWTAAFRPDKKSRRMIGKYNSTSLVPEAFFAWEGSRLGSRHAQGMAKMMVDTNSYSPSSGVYLLAWYIPTLPYDPPSAGPLDWYDPYGWYLGRTGWSFGSASTDITTFFHCAPKIAQTRGVLHWDVARGADDLICNTGFYQSDLDLHFSPWLTSTQGFNSVLVYDPTESYGTFKHDTQGSTMTDVPYPVTGAQNHYSNSQAKAKYPLCTWINEFGLAGEVDEISMTPERTVIDADATIGYTPGKASSVKRRWTWFRPNWILVQDRVVLTKDNLDVKSLLHMVHKPKLGITPTAIKGSWAQGGVFSTTIDQMVEVERGGSAARIYVISAEDGGNGSSQIRLIGGPSRNGLTWRQDQFPNDFGYVANNADVSYECYIEQTARNYMPSDAAATNDYYVAHRHDPPMVAADWRIEVTVNGADDTVDIAYLVHVTAKNAPYAEVTSNAQAGLLSIQAVENGDTLRFSACPPGTPCSDQSFDAP